MSYKYVDQHGFWICQNCGHQNWHKVSECIRCGREPFDD